MGEIWLVTGTPGIGKSTLVSRVVMKLRSAGVIVGGCTTAEKRTDGTRVGFEVTDLLTGKKGDLSSTATRLGPRVGRYRVNLKDLAKVGASALEAASTSSEAIVIDEVGPMELVSPEFRRGVARCMASGKPLLAVIHERMEDDLLNDLRSKAKESVTITLENRDGLADELASKLLAAAGGPKF